MNRLERIRQEAAALAKHYGPIEWDDLDGSWTLIRSFPLPSSMSKRWTPLLITIPPTYPSTPPYGFYLDKELPLGGHYHENNNDLSRAGWAWFCLHLERGWRATADIWSGDNLMTVAAAVSAALTEITR